MQKKGNVNTINHTPLLSNPSVPSCYCNAMFIAHQDPFASCSAKILKARKALTPRLWGLEITSRFQNMPFLSPAARLLHKWLSLSGPLSSPPYLFSTWLLILYFRSPISHIWGYQVIYHAFITLHTSCYNIYYS